MVRDHMRIARSIHPLAATAWRCPLSFSTRFRSSGVSRIERVKRLVHATLVGLDRGDLFGQRYDTVTELRDCRYVGRCGRTAQVRRKSLGFARRPAEQKPTPVGFGQATRRFVEEYLVQYDRTADVQAQFAVRRNGLRAARHDREPPVGPQVGLPPVRRAFHQPNAGGHRPCASLWGLAQSFPASWADQATANGPDGALVPVLRAVRPLAAEDRADWSIGPASAAQRPRVSARSSGEAFWNGQGRNELFVGFVPTALLRFPIRRKTKSATRPFNSAEQKRLIVPLLGKMPLTRTLFR